MKFKVGDKVKILSTDYPSDDSDRVGTVGVMVSYDPSATKHKYMVKFKDEKQFDYREQDLELAKGYKPKKVTHIVIWDEDEDPHKLFTDEQSAREHVLKLSEDENVQKDSILFVEVKSVRKVTIDKNLRFAKYKV